MTVTFYVNCDYRNKNFEILTPEEFEEKIAELANEFFSDDDGFDDYLSDHYSARDIFNFTQATKAKVVNDYRESCRQDARQDMNSLYSIVIKEV